MAGLICRHSRLDPGELSLLLDDVGADGESIVSLVQRLVQTGVLDRIAARAVYLILTGKLDSRELRQLLPRDRVCFRQAVRTSDAGGEPPALAVGDSLSRYRIDEVIHVGPHANVYRCWHPQLGRTVAVKVAREGTAAKQLANEAAALARVTHSCVLRIWDAGQANGHSFLVSDYHQAGSLRDLLRRRGRLSVRRAFAVARDTVRGLRAAWRAGMTHGDIKPSNLLLHATGRIIVADFGLASPTDAGYKSSEYVTGSWPYLAPERFDGQGDHRADIYSLGLTLYHLLTGIQPISGQSQRECLRAHQRLRLDPPHWSIPGISREASALVLRMVARDPADRPSSYDELLAELTAACPPRRPTASPDHSDSITQARPAGGVTRPAALRPPESPRHALDDLPSRCGVAQTPEAKSLMRIRL